MGFLERQRQDNEARERQATQEREARKRQEDEATRKGNAEHELRLQRAEQARRYIQESGIDRMANQLVELFRWEKKDIHRTGAIYDANGLRYDLGRYHAEFSVRWDKRVGGSIVYTGFEVKGDHNGTIAISGGFLGSTTLTKSQWKDKPDVVESALEKAYRRPKKIEVHTSYNRYDNS